MHSPKISVIGSSVLSLHIAAAFAATGSPVAYIDLSDRGIIFELLSREASIGLTGLEHGQVRIEAASRSLDCAAESEIVAITVTPSCYERCFEELVPLLHAGQHVILFPASFGGLLLSRMISSGRCPEVTIAEAASFPCVCSWKDSRTILVHSIKQSLQLAVYPKARTESEIDFYRRYFPMLTPARNTLETSLGNINSVLHPFPVLLNLGKAERDPANFRHFVDGFTPKVGKMAEMIDRERLSVGKAYGLKLCPVLDQLACYYGESEAASLAEYVSNPEGPYADVRGFGVDSRYLSEDIPYLLVPALTLGLAAGVPMPASQLCLQLADAVLGTDFLASGFSLSRLGLAGLSSEELVKAVEGD